MKQVKFSFLLIAFSLLLISSCMSSTGKNNGGDSLTKTGNSMASGDMYYEYSIISMGKDMRINGTSKMYISADGNVRAEMIISNSAAGNKKMSPIINIGNSSKPNESITIDDDTKTYTVNNINPDSLGIGNLEKIQSTVTKIGEEKILGFNCVHARVISTKDIGGFYKFSDTMDVWRSKDVPLQPYFKKYMEKYEKKTGSFTFSPAAIDQLKQMGCEGLMVKLEMKTKNGGGMTEELVKVEHRDLPKSLFTVPAGYKEE